MNITCIQKACVFTNYGTLKQPIAHLLRLVAPRLYREHVQVRKNGTIKFNAIFVIFGPVVKARLSLLPCSSFRMPIEQILNHSGFSAEPLSF